MKELGFFSMGFVLTGLFSAAHALRRAYAHLLEHGESESLRDQMLDFGEFVDFIGVQERYDDDARYRSGEPDG